ncbi:hypothetical protein M422DRAFT_272464 [Sphaerobolus stellatus SS14]|uniref:Uncharacterized protein n=1 Tax=Sphaerobolus stellatus (strain SS14) TaxID=990650 RepID=A0A0C9UMK1_SPHS4|nr:hypothetical protein M422DRAFT_272464 [Sphaerobolus stellatus SS14]
MGDFVSTSRPNPAPVKVICLGLCRTGTSSLRDALEILGLGPCYHWTTIVERNGKDFETWAKIGDGKGWNNHVIRVLLILF